MTRPATVLAVDIKFEAPYPGGALSNFALFFVLAKRCAICLALGSLSFVAATLANAEPSAREKWLAAVDVASPDWSRKSLLDELLGGEKPQTREQSVALFGPPDVTTDLYSRGSDFVRIDEYRLSAADTEKLRLDSDADGRLKRLVVEEGGACACPLCRRVEMNFSAVLTSETVSHYLAILKTVSIPTPLGSIETDVGRAGLHEGMQSERGNRSYLTTSAIWRFADVLHRFFIVSGGTPLLDRPQDAAVAVGLFALRSESNACLMR